MPAWLERNGTRQPLAPGMTLQSQDEVRTGGTARLVLKLPEGSTVKLGENAILKLDTLTQRGAGADNVFVAAMNVLAGAFRYTTAVLTQARKREVAIRVATITAGIRGTDVWGKTEADRDIVCLLEGRIEVQSGGEPPFK